MKRLFSIFIVFAVIFSLQQSVFAYSYGDPGEEQIAEAYKEVDNYIKNGEWDQAQQVVNTYEKEFSLYFQATVPLIEKAFEEKDEELLLSSYQAALRLNIERRLHFANEQFEDYGQAKLLLAKARGTFNVLAPIATEKAEDENFSQNILTAFDTALASLGNPGLFGIGQKESDYETFKEQTDFVLEQITPLFPVPSDDEAHLTEENLDLLNGEGESNSSFWLWFSIILFVVLIGIIVINKRKK